MTVCNVLALQVVASILFSRCVICTYSSNFHRSDFIWIRNRLAKMELIISRCCYLLLLRHLVLVSLSLSLRQQKNTLPNEFGRVLQVFDVIICLFIVQFNVCTTKVLPLITKNDHLGQTFVLHRALQNGNILHICYYCRSTLI